jgi:hypothetical protein
LAVGVINLRGIETPWVLHEESCTKKQMMY